MSKTKIRFYLAKDTFNYLVEVLAYFCRTETSVGKNSYSVLADNLKFKMANRARLFTNEHGEGAAIVLYEEEVTLLVKLLADYAMLTFEKVEDTYAQIKKRKAVTG